MITAEQVERINQLITESATFYHKRSDEMMLALRYEMAKANPDAAIVLILTAHYEVWQALAHGARGEIR